MYFNGRMPCMMYSLKTPPELRAGTSVPKRVWVLVRSFSGKNWKDRAKADKASISFPVTPNDQLKCF